MVKTTKKQKTKPPKSSLGRPRTRSRTKTRKVGATVSETSSSTTKFSQKHRIVVRKAADALRKSQERNIESQETRSRRRAVDASRKALVLSEESEEVGTKRKRLHAVRVAKARSNETIEEHTNKKSSDAARKARARSKETEDAISRRRAQDKDHRGKARSVESHEASESRKSVDRKKHASHITKDLGIARQDVEVEENYLGKMSIQCSSCGALHYKGEQPQSKMFNSCCRHGLVQLPNFDSFPEEFLELFTGSSPESTEFLQNIRTYNNSLAMGSMAAKLDIPKGGGPYTFRLHGQVYHVIGALHPDEGQHHKFAQVFILDTEEAAEQLANQKINRMCSKDLYKKLIGLLHKYNPFVNSFKMMREKEEEEEELARAENRDLQDVKMVFRRGKNLNPNRYQLPTANEIAVVFVGDENEIPGKRAITVYQRSSGKLQYLLDTDMETDPLCYPLLFIDGRYGWHINQKRLDGHGGNANMSAREFYSYYLHVRSSFCPLHYAKKLFQQYCVDVWTKIEQNRLNFVRQHQDRLRVESVQGLMDHINSEDGGPCGKSIFLPDSFIGSPRHFVSQYQDALSVVSRFGKPDLFLTVTCNPHWKEIEEALMPGQVAADRPDIVARVFKLKIEEIGKDLFVRQIFGEVVAWISVIEFQKRGLPHMHLLMILKNEWKPRTASDVDNIVCAELPNPEEDPNLYEIISTMQMHRPCGIHNPDSPCMSDGVCTKHFPKEFRPTTGVENDGFPMYRRRDDGRTVTFKTKNSGVIELDNRNVVPYNKYLSRKYRSHANLEICGNVGAVKYLYKYQLFWNITIYLLLSE